MKKLFLFTVAQLLITSALAQVGDAAHRKDGGRFDLRIGAGSTATFVPDFQNTILVANGAVIPGLINPMNSYDALTIVKGNSSASVKAGWYVEGEVDYALSHGFSLSLSVGLQQLRYDYDTQFATTSLDVIHKEFGKTNLLYLTITPLNLGKSLLKDRLVLRVGPTFNLLQKDEMKNVLVVYETPQSVEAGLPDAMFFDTVGKPKKMIYGINFAASYKIVEAVNVKLSAQYFVNSIYEKEGLYHEIFGGYDVEKINPLVAQLGLTLSPFRF